MEYFHDEKNVMEYLRMAEGFDGRDLIEVLKRYLGPGSTILEIGMGPGKDLDILLETYKAVGSDYSGVFLDLYRKTNPDADILNLDARSLETERRFDCVYSNKVLGELSREDTITSLKRQKEVLTVGGILFHALWKGKGEEDNELFHHVYYMENELIEMVRDDFDVIEIESYAEMEDDDSIYIVLRKKQ